MHVHVVHECEDNEEYNRSIRLGCIGYTTGWLAGWPVYYREQARVLIYMTIFSSLSYCINPHTTTTGQASQAKRRKQQLDSVQSWFKR